MRSSSSALEPQPAHSGFTRVELLVILACLTLLALAQLPLLGKSREGGHEAVCMNNLRQLGLAMLMSAAENQDQVPEEGNTVMPINDVTSGNLNEAWYNAVVPMIKQPSLVSLYTATPPNPPLPSTLLIYSCPTAAPPDKALFPSGPTLSKAFFMYGENGRICINRATRGSSNTKLSTVPKPSGTILVAEGDGNSLTAGAAPSSVIGQYAVARHLGLGLFAMTDGHVRSAQTNEFRRTSAEGNSASVEWAIPRTMYWYPTPTTWN